MFEYLKLFAVPIVWIIIFLVCGLAMTLKVVRRSLWSLIGWFFCLLSLLIVVLMSTQPAESLLVTTLESKYPPVSKSDLERLAVMVILGGGVESKGSYQRAPEASGSTYSRLFNGVEAFKKSKAGKLILSGGIAEGESVSEAHVMQDLAVKLGVPQSKIITEERSRTTEEQVRELRKMGMITNNTTVGFVTSAIHMMRSVALFKKEFPGVEIIPIPAGYVYAVYVFSFKDFIPTEKSFHQSSLAIHEWLGWLLER